MLTQAPYSHHLLPSTPVSHHHTVEPGLNKARFQQPTDDLFDTDTDNIIIEDTSPSNHTTQSPQTASYPTKQPTFFDLLDELEEDRIKEEKEIEKQKLEESEQLILTYFVPKVPELENDKVFTYSLSRDELKKKINGMQNYIQYLKEKKKKKIKRKLKDMLKKRIQQQKQLQQQQSVV